MYSQAENMENWQSCHHYNKNTSCLWPISANLVKYYLRMRRVGSPVATETSTILQLLSMEWDERCRKRQKRRNCRSPPQGRRQAVNTASSTHKTRHFTVDWFTRRRPHCFTSSQHPSSRTNHPLKNAILKRRKANGDDGKRHFLPYKGEKLDVNATIEHVWEHVSFLTVVLYSNHLLFY